MPIYLWREKHKRLLKTIEDLSTQISQEDMLRVVEQPRGFKELDVLYSVCDDLVENSPTTSDKLDKSIINILNKQKKLREKIVEDYDNRDNRNKKKCLIWIGSCGVVSAALYSFIICWYLLNNISIASVIALVLGCVPLLVYIGLFAIILIKIRKTNTYTMRKSELCAKHIGCCIFVLIVSIISFILVFF